MESTACGVIFAEGTKGVPPLSGGKCKILAGVLQNTWAAGLSKWG